jgi:hypothetical protein
MFVRIARVGTTPESEAWVDATEAPGSENRIAPPSAGPNRPQLTIVKGQVHDTTAVKYPRTRRGYPEQEQEQIVLGQSLGDNPNVRLADHLSAACEIHHQALTEEERTELMRYRAFACGCVVAVSTIRRRERGRLPAVKEEGAGTGIPTPSADLVLTPEVRSADRT